MAGSEEMTGERRDGGRRYPAAAEIVEWSWDLNRWWLVEAREDVIEEGRIQMGKRSSVLSLILLDNKILLMMCKVMRT